MNQKSKMPLLSSNLIKELNENDIRYCHWKSNEHLREALYGITDLDILVDRSHKNKFQEVVSKLNFKKIASQSYLSFSGVEDWLGFCEETGVLLHLHVHYNLITGAKFVKEYSFPWQKYVLDTAFDDEMFGMKVTNPNAELILLLLRIGIKVKYTTLLKSVIKRKAPYSKYIQSELEYLKDRVTQEELTIVLGEMFAENSVLAPSLQNLIHKDNLTTKDVYLLKRLINKEMSIWKKYNSIEVACRYLKGLSYMKFHALRERLGFYTERRKKFEVGGISIAFIGSDGAGKTTIVSNIDKWLKWKADVHQFYLGSGDNTRSLILKVAQKLIKVQGKNKRTATKQQGGSLKKNKLNFITKFKLFLKTKLFIYMAKEKARNIKKAQKLKLRGSIVIADRFPQMQFVGQNDSPNIRQHVLNYHSNSYFEKSALKEESLYAEMLKYPPDVVIKLIVKPEIAIKRKPDHDYEQIEKKVNIISGLKFESSEVYEVDANLPVEQVSLAIRRIIWDNL